MHGVEGLTLMNIFGACFDQDRKVQEGFLGRSRACARQRTSGPLLLGLRFLTAAPLILGKTSGESPLQHRAVPGDLKCRNGLRKQHEHFLRCIVILCDRDELALNRGFVLKRLGRRLGRPGFPDHFAERERHHYFPPVLTNLRACSRFPHPVFFKIAFL
jgi:hypothetical protein